MNRPAKSACIVIVLVAACIAAPSPAFAGRVFRVQPKAGSQWMLHCVSHLDASLNIVGAKATPYSECETISATITVDRINADGVTELLLCIDKVEVSQIMRHGGQEYTTVYDSSAPRPADPSERWEDLEARHALFLISRTGLTLKQNGELKPRALEGERGAPAGTRKCSCPPSPAWVFASAMSDGAFELLCVPERAVAAGAAWHHDATRSEFNGDPAPARLSLTGVLGIPRKRTPSRAVSKYDGRHVIQTREVERITTAYSGAFGESPQTKVEGESFFDSVSGDLLGASWRIEAKAKQAQWLGVAAVTVATSTRVTLAQAGVESSLSVEESEPGVGADSR